MRSTDTPAVLFVDDDAHHAEIYGRVIAKAGVRVIAVQNGGEAIEIAKSQPLVGAILDYSFPRTDGAAVARTLKLVRPTLPILFLSAAFWLPEDAKPYAWGFVSKGNPEKLIMTVKQLVAEASAKQAIRSAFGASV